MGINELIKTAEKERVGVLDYVADNSWKLGDFLSHKLLKNLSWFVSGKGLTEEFVKYLKEYEEDLFMEDMYYE